MCHTCEAAFESVLLERFTSEMVAAVQHTTSDFLRQIRHEGRRKNPVSWSYVDTRRRSLLLDAACRKRDELLALIDDPTVRRTLLQHKDPAQAPEQFLREVRDCATRWVDATLDKVASPVPEPT